MIRSRLFARYKNQHDRRSVFRHTDDKDYFSEESIEYEFLTDVSSSFNMINLFSDKESIQKIHENTKLVSSIPKQDSFRFAEIAKLESISKNKMSVYEYEHGLFNIDNSSDIHDCFMIENTKVLPKYNKSQRHTIEPETCMIERQRK